MESKYFTCHHCHRRCLRNFRIKSGQHYCGSPSCQQARKNKWERDKSASDTLYRQARSAAKKAWYRAYPGDRYQHSYRAGHPGYVTSNRAGQRTRTARLKGPSPEIVKTDASSSATPFPSGFYKLLPFDSRDMEKIVKTDALIVELRPCGGLQEFYHRSGP
ncbi:MAG TPA: hypothetical protein GXX42_10640 [Petrimonas sp.]|nr:hypothetical protein [Petrimonas sp.]MEA5062439.1 hypothetical protein [Petrimonas sp.]HHV86250.1 hypothetical protein [Petrimonas sp.]